MAFNEDLYLAETPAAREAIANGLYKTGLEYYLAVGRFSEGQEGFFEGTSGNDVIVGVSGAENHIGGVATNVEGEYIVDPDAPFGLSGTITLTPQSLGVGEVDLLVGTAGTLDEFFLSVELKLDIGTDSGETVPVYVGTGDRDHGIIRNFSAADGDIIVLAGKPKDYLYESVNGNVEISTINGDLVGVVEGVSSLSVLEDLASYNQTILMSGDKSIPNVFDIVPSGFDEEFYLGIYPEVRELVNAGVFESGLDHYQAYGQYVPTENKYQEFATGTNGNDTLIGFGTYEVDYFPVAMSYVEEAGDYTFESLGVGEVDTIIAVPNIINEFILSSFPTGAYDTAEQFYVGNGDADYARIQNLKEAGKGEFYFIGKREDFLFEDKEGDVYVSYKDDLVTIIEGIAVSDLQITDTYQYQGFDAVDAVYEPTPFIPPEFQPSPINPYDGSIYLRNFDEDVYLAAFPTVAQDIADGKYESALDHYLQIGQFQGSDTEGTFTGSSDSDIVLSFGANKLLWGIGATATVDANIPTRFNIVNDSLGEGELDVLVGSDGVNEFQLTAYNYVDFAGTADSVPLYVGGGDTDYALVRNFKDGDSVVLSGNPADYKYGVNNGNYEIYTLSGDLVGIVEDVNELQVGGVFDSFEVFELVSGSAAGGFDEDYYVKQFDLQKLIADGVVASGTDHYQTIGQYGFSNDIKYQELVTGTDGNDTLIGYGKFEVDFWGVGIEYISKDVTVDFGITLPPEITDKRLRRYESFGEGEIDTMISVPGIINEYILGSSTNILYSEARPFYVGQGDNDYALIKNIKTTSVGELVFSGDFAKYTFEDEENGLHAYYEDDLVAIFEDLKFSELGEREEYPTRGIFVYEYAPKGTEYFNESLYLTFNPEVAELVEQGVYTSGLDHYIQVGQFGNNEGFFTGTEGNDAITGFGEDLDLAGVGITATFDGEKYTLTPSSLGVGEIDTLLGTENEDGFYLGIPTVIDEVNGNTTQALYIGEGTQDYGLIKNFSQGDYIFLAGTPDEYIYKSEGGDFKIYSASGDLVGVVKDVVELQTSFYTEGSQGFYLGITEAGFDDEGWVSLYPEVQEQIDAGFFESPLDQYVNVGQYEEGGWVFEGTTGNDTLISWTQNAEVRLTGVTIGSGFEPAGFEDGQYYFGVNPTSFGVGEIDILVHSADTGTIAESLLGWFRSADGSIQRFYVGQGDEDYALVKNFDKNDLDEIFLGGAPDDYTYEDVDGNLHIAYQGDLVGIVEGVKFGELELADEGEGSGAFVLIGKPDLGNEFYDTYIKPFFYEPLYPIVNPDVDALIEQGLYESYYDHLIKAGQFEDREDTMFVGTSGDDVMSGIGAESILVGVAISDATYPPPDVKPVSTGVGEIDTLLGSSGENIFALGNGLLLNDTAEAFYIGEGDNDYALIKNFDDTLDFITMAGVSSDYTFTAVDGNVRIAKDGDLIAIVEGDINLVAYPPSAEAGGFYISGAANEELAEFNKAYFNEAFFLAQNPEAQEAIDNGEYDSAFDYHLNNGGKLTAAEGQQFTLWHGTGERDFVGAFGGEAGLIGVKVTDFEVQDGLPVAFTTETNGTGEQDFLYGAPEKNIFYLGNLGENAESFYVGNGDEDYATIINFDPKQDYIALANDLADETIVFFSIYDKYTFTEVDGNTEIATKDGDLVAIVEGATGLKPFTGYTPAGTTYLVSTENEFFDIYVKPTFFEPWYLEQDAADYDNSVQKAIDAGLVTDAYDHYLKIGQFEAREDSIFAGGEGDDTIYGTGAEPVLIGVDITEAVYARDNKPVTTGVGDVDTLIGAPGGDTFVLGNGAVINDAPQAYYVGEGDADYALIKGLSGNSVAIPNPQYEDATIDRLFLAGRVYDYIFAKDGDDLRISTRDGDLIAIVEDAPVMETPFSVPGATYLYGIDNVKTFDNLWGASGGFYEPFYLAENPEVEALIANGEYESAVDHYFKVGQFKEDSEAIFHDPNNEGFTVGYGAADLLFGVALTSVDGEKEGWTSDFTGVGEQDFFIGGAGVTTYVIGNDNILEPGKAPDVYYVGEGDDDYVFIQSFDPYKDFIFAAGEFSDYTIEMVDDTQDVFGRIVPIKNIEISYKGDLVAILNNIGGSLTLPDGFTLQEFPLGDERPNALVLVAPQNEFLPSDPATYFNESVYLTLHPKVQELIDNGEYESAYDYYLEVGEDKRHRAFLTGTAEGNDDITAIGDKSTLFGVEVAGFDKENNRFFIEDDGAGEIDSLTGNEGRNRFVLGNNGQSFYVGNGDEDYANIYDFDPFIDSLVIAGDLGDYQIDRTETESTTKDLKISTKDGDLVAIIRDVGDLVLATRPVDPVRFSGDSVVVSTDHRGLQKELADNFFEPYYAFNNPQAVEAVANGEYDSVYEYYLEVGRFSEEGIQFTYWEGTSGNDRVTGIGDDIGLFGVDVTTIERQALVPHGIIGIETEDTGVGTVDILIGQAGGGETVYNLGKTGLSSAPNPTPFYVGEGDNDYALIKNFDPFAEEQFVSLVGTPADYTITQEDGNTRISYHDDLIAIVEGTPNLSVLPFFSRDNRFFLASLDAEGFAESTEFNFYEDLYLDLNPDVVEAIANGEYESAFDHYAKVGRLEGREGVIFNGTGIFGGNDIVTDLGGDGEAALIGVPISNLEIDEATEQFGIETASDGTGEIDALIGTEAMNLFVLGKNGSLTNPTPTPFYVGNGDSDYAKVWDFDATADFLFLAGSLNDYIFEGLAPYAELDDDSVTPKWEKETKIYTKEGDLIAIIDGIDSLTPFPATNPGGFYLVSGENTHLAEAVEPTFFEPYYLIQNPDVQGLIDAGEYASAYDHFIQVGQFEKREDTFFNGTEGDDVITALGYESIIAGVPISEASYAGGIDIKPTNLGSGQVDTLMGGLGYESFIMLGNGTVLNDTPNSFYLGNGDADYALIKGFTVDYNFEEESYTIYHIPILGGDGTKYTYESVDGDTHISLNGDLVAIVEDVPILIPDAQGEGLTYLYSPDFDAWYTDFNTPKFFAEDAYLANNPDIRDLIDAGEYESGIDHFLHTGIFEEGRIAVYQGSAGNDNEVWGTGTSIIFGVEVTDIDTESLTFTTGSTGVGEVDSLSGSPHANTFVLGNNGESFYVGNGDEDYVTVEIFDATKDRILLAGEYEDYTFETVAGEEEGKGDLKILTKEGDLVAIVKSLGGKVADLKPFTGSTPAGGTYLISLENEFFSTYAEANFYAPIYPEQNPDVDALIAAGEYTSYYDHFLKAGQFEEREDTFFVGTEGNDTLYALGFETVLVGVPISDATYGPVDVVPLSLGTGQVDTLYGGNTFEAIYVLGNGTQLNETAQSFYLGEGDADYALIKDFSPNDVIFMGSEVSNFTQEVVDGNLEISKDGDLIAIVENSGLLVGNGEFFNNFNYIQGKADDDTLDLSGTANAIGVPLTLTEDYLPLATSTGVGEVDTFNFLDTEATNPIYLGFNTVDSPDTPQTFYLGNGDADYALIKNFNPLTDHSVLIPGKFEDYEVEVVEGNTRLSKGGDLIAIVENTILVPDFEDGGFTNLYPSEDEYFVNNTKPFFNEDIYLAENPDVADAIAADEYTSGYQHFMRVGLLEGRDAYYNGTAGDDGDIYAMGNSYVLGVPITGFDALTGQFTTATTGTGEVDGLTGTIGVNKFVLGSNGTSFYLGNGNEDAATVNGFDVLKDELILGGSYDDYTFTVVEENLQISLGDDLVATVNGVTELQEKMGDDTMGMFTLVAPEFTGIDPFAV